VDAKKRAARRRLIKLIWWLIGFWRNLIEHSQQPLANFGANRPKMFAHIVVELVPTEANASLRLREEILKKGFLGRYPPDQAIRIARPSNLHGII
jgi:hypothetical protein